VYRNDSGKFVDVSEKAGVAQAQKTYGMTAVAADFDDDGWMDVYVASDSTPSLFFRNQGDGTFIEEGLERGVAVNEDGREQAGMGVGVGDFNGDGRLDIFKTHFSDDTHVLYRNDGKGMFSDVTLAAGLAVETRYIGWGASLSDFDNDGWADIFFVTGSVYPELDKKGIPNKTPSLLFRNLADGRFEQIPSSMAGAPIDVPRSSRGSLAMDYDNDGDLDLFIWNRNEPPTLLRNDMPAGRRWIQFEAPLGTRITLTLPDGRRFVQEVVSQSSFYSAPGRVLHFGLGDAASVDALVRMPNGKAETRKGLAANSRIRIPN
jgi:hypothetical protein